MSPVYLFPWEYAPKRDKHSRYAYRPELAFVSDWMMLIGALQRFCTAHVVESGIFAGELLRLLSPFGLPQQMSFMNRLEFDRIVNELMRMNVGAERERHFIAQDETEATYWKRGQFLQEVFGITIRRKRDKETGHYLYYLWGDKRLIPFPSSEEDTK